MVRWMDHLSPVDQFMVRASLQGHGQIETANLLGLGQPAVHYRWSRIVMRAGVLERIGEHPRMKLFLKTALQDKDALLAWLYWQTPSQKVIADYLGIRQSTLWVSLQRTTRNLLGVDSPMARAWLLMSKHTKYLRWTRPSKGPHRIYGSGTARPGTLRDWLLSVRPNFEGVGLPVPQG